MYPTKECLLVEEIPPRLCVIASGLCVYAVQRSGVSEVGFNLIISTTFSVLIINQNLTLLE